MSITNREKQGAPSVEKHDKGTCRGRGYQSPDLVQVGALKDVQGFQGRGRDITRGAYFTSPHG
jgi:hypothetical protein